jgi:hypothetical protein
MNLIRSTAVSAALVFAAACATKGAATENAPRRDRSVITQEEIDGTTANDAYGIVRALRPAWLLPKTVGSRQQSVQVYVEGNKAGTTTALQQYNKNQVSAMKFLTGDEATTRFGTGNGAGAILVTLRR